MYLEKLLPVSQRWNKFLWGQEMKIKRIKNPEELSIGQMYMYKDCGRYKRGYVFYEPSIRNLKILIGRI